MIEIRPAEYADAIQLAPRLRVEDALEIGGRWSVDTLEGLFVCLLRSDRAFAVCERGTPLALWGVSDDEASGLRLGVPWLLASQRLFDHRREVAGRSRQWVDRLLLDYDVLCNLTDAANETHLRWLGWCGFHTLRTHGRFGEQARPFVEFYRVNEGRVADAEVVRRVLARRNPPEPGAPPPRLLALARLGAGMLRGDGDTVTHFSERLAELEEACPPGSRLRVAATRLLLEVAAVTCRDGARAGESLGTGRAWCEVLCDTAEALHLAPVADPARTLCRARQWLHGRLPGRPSPARPADGSRHGGPPLTALAVHCLEGLTLGGELDVRQGYRLWSAVLGTRPLPRLLARRAPLVRALREHQIARVWCPEEAPARGTGDVHGALVGSLRRWPALDAALMSALARARPPQTAGQDPVLLASAVADGMTRSLLPALRFGVVVAGHGESHALYRLLRAHLLTGLGMSRRSLQRLLVDELIAVLAAADFQDSLLACHGPVSGEAAARYLAKAAGSGWGGGDDPAASRRTAALLWPALAVPADWQVQLPAALVCWDLVARGTLDDVLDGVSLVLAQDETRRHAAVRKLLRRRLGAIDMLTIRKHLEDHGRSRCTIAGPSNHGGRPGA